MYFVLVFVLCWLFFFFKADKSRARELFPVCVYTSFLGLFTDLLMVEYKLWSYTGLPHSLYTIPLLLDFGIYPVVAYLFCQNLPEQWKQIFKRAVLWMIPAIIFEWVTILTGNMQHHMWWTLWLSLLSDIIIYLSIALVYRYYRSAYEQGRLKGEWA